MTSKKLRPLTGREAANLLTIGAHVASTVDDELGGLLMKIAMGDDGVIPAVHDRCNVLGRFDLADRLKTLMEGRS